MIIDDLIKSAMISIHALCEEGDRLKLAWKLFYAISIHALCEEGDARARHAS